jgi:hypothetical protein
MSSLAELGSVAVIGFVTTSSSILGAAVGLYAPLSKRVLACVLAFAAGALISALAIARVSARNPPGPSSAAASPSGR